jgi:hypothetical protein
MKLPVTLFSACFVASLFDGGLAMSQTARTSQTASATHRQAMEECLNLYGGWRGTLGRDRYAYIEACFKQKTGMYPFQVNITCTYQYRGRVFGC